MKHAPNSNLLARKVIRSLLIFQLVVFLPALFFSFTHFASLALLLAVLSLIVSLGVVAWLYNLYQVNPLVREKRTIQKHVSKLQTQIHSQNTIIQTARQTREKLPQAEQDELAASLTALQKLYINAGLTDTLIANASIPGIGPKLKERLLAGGFVSTADFDIRKITAIEGFGTAKTQAMLVWYTQIHNQLIKSQPTALPAEQISTINAKFRTKHTENDLAEHNAKGKKDEFEKEITALQPRLTQLAPITFVNYIRQAIAPQGTASNILIVVFIFTQICMGASATVGSIAVSIPPTPLAPIVDAFALQTASIQTVVASLTLSAPTATFTSTSTINPSPSLTAIISQETSTGATLQPASGDLYFHFVNVGQGDSTVIQTPDGQTMLIDGGETDTGIVQYLQSLSIQRIDLMIATHPHSDHIGGLVQVLQSFPVAKVVTNGQPHTTSVYEHFLNGISTAQAEYVEVKRGDVFSLGGINFKVLNPANNNNPDLNENSIVFQFKYGQTTFLMMGDSGAVTEAALLSAGLPLEADILKVGHHGSTSGSTMVFLNTVKPKIVLYSAGINNQYGHPAPQTIATLKAVGAMVYGTDQNGTISLKVDLSGYTINTVQDVVKATPVLPTVIVATIPPLASGVLGIVSVTSPVSKGANATLIAKTSPNASCSITVYYKSGPSSASGLGPKTADASGMVSWTWKVGPKTTSGAWRIMVNCNGVTKETTIEVQ